MPAIAGRDVLIKYDADGAGAGTAVTVAAARTVGFTVANEMIDITTADDAGVRQILNDVASQTHSASFEGILSDDTMLNLHRNAGKGTALHFFELHINFATPIVMRGQWFLPSFEITGEYNSHATASFSLESAGAIVTV